MNIHRRRRGSSSPLAQSALKVVVNDLLAEYELRHTFRNEGEEAIEVVYSFPVPLDAAFGGMEATLAGETLVAQVLPAKQANRRYDEAIGDGNSAVLLEQVEPGMLCVNLGNLKPGERGEIVLRFYAALNVADGIARFSLPLVHRPRYGRTTLDEIVNPSHDFAVEHPLEAEIRVRGLLAGRPVQCAAQGASFVQEQGETVLRIGKAMLDRDLVLNFDLGDAPLAEARLVDDGEESIGVVTFTVPQVKAAADKANDICLLLDCSGSMAGDATVQSRQALKAVVDALQANDRIQVIRFGSRTKPLFRRPLQALPRVKDALCELAATVDADMGGTEMGVALEDAMAALVSMDGGSSGKVVILVTDGAVSEYEIADAKKRATKLGIRIFVVAVGGSAAVDVLAPLATETRAVLERAVPAEPIDAGVMRQFRRARSAPVQIVLDWKDAGAKALPLGMAYPGDAVTAIALMAGKNLNKATVSVAGSSPLELEFGAAQDMAGLRVWAGQRAYVHADEEDKETIALRYGLISEETKAVLVKVRAENDKADGLPVVTPVAHMIPDGMVAERYADSMSVSYKVACMVMGRDAPRDASMDYMDVPAFLRRGGGEENATSKSVAKKAPPELNLEEKLSLVQALLALLMAGKSMLSIDDVVDLLDSRLKLVARVWLEFRCADRVEAGVLQTLLLETEPDLSDEQEAVIAVFLGKELS